VRMQDFSGTKYLDFHKHLLRQPGSANKALALSAAQEAGVEMGQLQKDMESAEVQQTLDESRALAQAVGIQGTPGYIVGGILIPGAIGVDALKAKIANARAGSNG
jgi:protein-disulfide isomerase